MVFAQVQAAFLILVPKFLFGHLYNAERLNVQQCIGLKEWATCVASLNKKNKGKKKKNWAMHCDYNRHRCVCIIKWPCHYRGAEIRQISNTRVLGKYINTHFTGDLFCKTGPVATGLAHMGSFYYCDHTTKITHNGPGIIL